MSGGEGRGGEGEGSERSGLGGGMKIGNVGRGEGYDGYES